MTTLSGEQVLGMLFDPDFDSGGESEIEEDPAFPLPRPEEVDRTPSPPPPPSPPRRRGRGRGRSRGRGRGRERDQERKRSPITGKQTQPTCITIGTS